MSTSECDVRFPLVETVKSIIFMCNVNKFTLVIFLARSILINHQLEKNILIFPYIQILIKHP